MALKEILENEGMRPGNGDAASVFLHKEGTFYRAYEWSAWLFVRYIGQLKVTRVNVKDGGEGAVFVGFPVQSLPKFVPEEYAVRDEGEKCVVVELPDDVFGGEPDIERLKEDFANWKSSVPQPVKRASMRQDLKDGAGEGQPRHLTSIMAQVLSFPLEQKSPMECMSFIASLKQQLSEIL